MNGNSNGDVDGNDNIPFIFRPKIKIEVSLDVLGDPGEADADEVQRIEDIVCGEEDPGDQADQGVCDLHDDVKKDIKRAEKCV